MEAVSPKRFLVIQLQPHPQLSLIEREPRAALTLEGEQYHQLTDGAVEVAFDRLISQGQLIGILIWVFKDEVWELLKTLPPGPWLQVSQAPRAVEVYFVPYESLIEDEIAGMGEQSLIGQVYTNASGAIAIWVDLSELLTTESEWAAILTAQRRWANSHVERDVHDVQ